MRWPWMTRSAHERHVEQIELHHQACAELMQEFLDREYARAVTDGKAKVQAWAREAAAAFFEIGPHEAKAAALAAFQNAERTFNPGPLTLSDHLYATTVKEDINAAVRS